MYVYILVYLEKQIYSIRRVVNRFYILRGKFYLVLELSAIINDAFIRE